MEAKRSFVQMHIASGHFEGACSGRMRRHEALGGKYETVSILNTKAVSG